MIIGALKRGFKTLAVKRKGRIAGKLAKQLRETRGVKIRNLAAERKAKKAKAEKLLGAKRTVK